MTSNYSLYLTAISKHKWKILEPIITGICIVLSILFTYGLSMGIGNLLSYILTKEACHNVLECLVLFPVVGLMIIIIIASVLFVLYFMIVGIVIFFDFCKNTVQIIQKEVSTMKEYNNIENEI